MKQCFNRLIANQAGYCESTSGAGWDMDPGLVSLEIIIFFLFNFLDGVSRCCTGWNAVVPS